MKLLSYKTFAKCGDGNNEDVFMANAPCGQCCTRFVVADGATTGFSGGRYAFALAQTFMATPTCTWRERLDRAKKLFDSKMDFDNMTWFQQQNYERGSFSTMLSGESVAGGILLTAVGDTCAFLVDKRTYLMKKCFPVPVGYNFARHPYLLGSTNEPWLFEPAYKKVCWHHILLYGEVLSGCWLLCATDAVSEYILRHRDDPETMRGLVAALKSNKLFAEWVVANRATQALRVDDSTLVLIDPL